MEMNENKEWILEVGTEEIAGRNILYAVRDGKQYQLDSLYDSAYMLEHWFSYVKEQGLRFRSKFFLFGIGNGMYARKLLSETDSDVQIFIYEPSRELFDLVKAQFPVESVIQNERVTVLIGDEIETGLGEAVDAFLSYEDLSGYIVSKYPNYTRLFPEKAKIFLKEIQLVINRRRAEHLLLERHGAAYYRNTFSNLPYLYQGKSLCSLWSHMPKGMPAFIISSGPSLDKNIEELKKAKKRGLIIAADSAVKALLAHDIIPDIFISVDGMKDPRHFEDVRAQKIPLVCNLQSNENMMHCHTGYKFFIKSLDFYLQEKMEAMGIEIPGLKTGGSVAHECFELARVLECNPIVLVGQDLAYTGNHTHSVSTVRGANNIDVTKLDTVMVEGVDGKPVLSSYEFQLYLQWFEQQIQQNEGVRVIDATEGGALIRGSEVRTLSDTITELCNQEYDFQSVFLKTEQMMNEKQIQEMKAFVLEIPNELVSAMRLGKQIKRDYEKMLSIIYQGKYHNNEFKKLYEKISEKMSELDQIGAMEYVQNLIQRETNEVLEKVYELEKDERSELITACTMGNTYIERVLKGLEWALPDIAERVRTEEEDDRK